MRSFKFFPLMFALMASSALSAAAYEAVVTAVRGTVLELDSREQVLRTLSPRAEVPEGHAIQTGPGAVATIILANGGVITLQPNTTLRLEQMQLDGPASMVSYQPLRPSPAPSRTRLRLDRGEVLGEVKGIRANSKFEITSAVGTAGISGTRFVVAISIVGDRYVMTITNLDGTVVSMIEGEAPVPVPPGSQAEIRATFDSETGAVVPLSTETQSAPPGAIQGYSSIIEDAVSAVEEDDELDLPANLIPLPGSGLDPEQSGASADVDPVVGTPL